MNLFLEYNKIIIKEKKVCCDGNSYLTNLQETSDKEKGNITKSGLVTYKNICSSKGWVPNHTVPSK